MGAVVVGITTDDGASSYAHGHGSGRSLERDEWGTRCLVGISQNGIAVGVGGEDSTHRSYRPCSVLENEHLAGESVFRHSSKMGLEGVVSKRLSSRYRSGRSKDWLKFKNPDA